jgi:biopolymer transport protein ExbD
MAISHGRSPEINVTPIIDVLLVLLIIFMVVAPSRPGRFETKVPARPRPDVPTPARSDLLVVTLDANHALTLNGTTLTVDELGDTLASVLVDRTDRTVIVRAPTGTTYREVVALVDQIKGAGAGPIGLQVDLLDA